MTDRGEVGADLVGATGQQVDLQKRQTVVLFQYLVGGGDGTGSVSLPSVGDVHTVLVAVFLQLTGQRILLFGHRPVHQTEIIFLYLAAFEPVVEDT